MGSKRYNSISRSIQLALFRDPNEIKKTVLSYILAFFTLFRIRLIRFGYELFKRLRTETWDIDEEEYRWSFLHKKGSRSLEPMGDLGYSGSTFFRTSNSKFLIKSLPRHFEHSFFRNDLFLPYCEYMSSHPESLLVRITDFLMSPYPTLGALLGISPSYHVIMENVLCGKDEDPAKDEWETYDLKPTDYFFPERDLLPQLTSEETMSKLVDTFEDKIRITRAQYEELKKTVDRDTAFLQSCNVVDYSLFLVRFPASSEPPVVGRRSQWRVGVPSTDGKWKYRAVLLDFFWAKHKLRAQAMTGMVQTFNVVGRKGPMTITTTAEEYQHKFMAMVDGLVQLQSEAQPSSSTLV
ncbi:hypothetical protein Plec18167_002044 [Paecilomyces lecythidis]|uniref:PIPK domain-containing protein n=1 Tax=Paecilomyces lecythidis TaxID=3004212 RepID=A0ABR3Y939_9EURO